MKRLGSNIPLCTVITDYDAHGTWISPEVDRYLVSTQEVKSKMLEQGVAASKIEVTGIPVHPNFWEHPVKEEIREKFGLKNMPTVMVMGGGWGIMNDEVINNYLTRWRDEIQIVFCLGNNEKVLRKLEQDPSYNHPNIRLIGFTPEVDKLMEVSDLLVTKPGGMTCTEGLAKGIPMLFHHPLPGQEEENCQYFTAQGLGEPISSLEVITKWMNKLIHEYDSIQQRREEQLKSIDRYRPMQSAQSIIDMLESNKVPS